MDFGCTDDILDAGSAIAGCSICCAGEARYRTFRKEANYCVPSLFATDGSMLATVFRCRGGQQPPWQRNAYEALSALGFASIASAAVCA
jgi:hypothetical protein